MTESNVTQLEITIEQVERLAAELEGQETEQRDRLLRLICAEARIVAAREPERFDRKPLRYQDEAGHWDNSFPPKQEYTDCNGPRLLRVRAGDYDQIATSSGFYYSWEAVTSERGLYVSRDGRIYGRATTGTGHFGQYAAHPGTDDVSLDLEWTASDTDDLTLDDLREVETTLRALAFPLSQAVA